MQSAGLRLVASRASMCCSSLRLMRCSALSIDFTCRPSMSAICWYDLPVHVELEHLGLELRQHVAHRRLDRVRISSAEMTSSAGSATSLV